MDSEGKPLTISEEITEKNALELACMVEVAQRSRMSEESPPMTAPRVYDLQYNGITQYGDDLLLGTAPDRAEIDPYTQAYLDQLVS
eukprot:7092939-Ditylum_brightwellii.AAC.1